MIPFIRHELQEISEEALRRKAGDSAALLYRQAFEEFGPLCFWSTRQMPMPSISDVIDAASRLKREGNMKARRLAVQIEDACLADL